MSEYSLEKSYRSVGPIYPVLVDKGGNVIDGFHRRQVDENWPVQALDWVRTREDQLVARIVANTCRRTVSREERKRELAELAVLMVNRGVPIGKIAEEIAEKTGLSTSYIRQLLPKRLKLESRVEVAKGRWEAEKKISEEKAPFAERGEILHLSEMQILPPFGERGEILPPPKPDLGKVEVKPPPETHEASKLFEEHYPKHFMEWVSQRLGEAVSDTSPLADPVFLRRTCRELIEIAWTRLSRSPLIEEVRREFCERVKALEAEWRAGKADH